MAVPAETLRSDRDKTTPVVGCSGAVSDPVGKRRLILGAVRLVLFVSARRSCESPFTVCGHDAQAPTLPGCESQMPGLKGTFYF